LEQLVTIELFGQPYTFKADSGDDKAKHVADTLVREVDKIKGKHNGPAHQMNKLTIMIVAALNIANENHELKAKYSELHDTVSERSNRLIRLLDAGYF